MIDEEALKNCLQIEVSPLCSFYDSKSRPAKLWALALVNFYSIKSWIQVLRKEKQFTAISELKFITVNYENSDKTKNFMQLKLLKKFKKSLPKSERMI